MPLSRIISSIDSTNTSLSGLLDEALEGKESAQQVDILVDFMGSCAEHDEVLLSLVKIIHDRLLDGNFFAHRFPSIEDLYHKVDYSGFVQPQLHRHYELEQKKLNNQRFVEEQWGVTLDALLGEFRPKQYSKHLVQELRKYSKLPGVTRSGAKVQLIRVINERNRHYQQEGLGGGYNHSKVLLKKDVEKAITLYNEQQKSAIAEDQEGSLTTVMADPEIMRAFSISSDRYQVASPTGDVIMRHAANEIASNVVNVELVVNDDQPVVHNTSFTKNTANPDKRAISASSDEDCETLIRNDDDDNRFELSMHQYSEATTSAVHRKKKARSAATKTTKECGCDKWYKSFWNSNISPQHNTTMNLHDGLQVAGRCMMAPQGLEGLCHRHLRHVASVTLGLKNSQFGLDSATLRARIDYCVRYRQHIISIRKKKAEWFVKAFQMDVTRQLLGARMYKPEPQEMLKVNQKRLWLRFGSADAFDEWERNGTINITDAFDWFLQHPVASTLINHEFEMYQHHYFAPGDTGSHMGWQRNMWYSLVQQVIRQDPVYYALTVAARPDARHWLISYPYYTKSTSEGQSTGFLHFDLNVGEFLRSGKGGAIVQGAVNITDEVETNCTVLVPGFHHHVKEWYENERKQSVTGKKTGTTGVNLSDWTQKEESRYGNMIKVANAAGTIRITRPEILHGSTAKATGIRRVVFPWLTGIMDDHCTLDNEESEKWEELSACHRNRSVCRLSPSGQSTATASDGNVFEGSVELELNSNYPIGRALLGQTRWDDIRVVKSQSILFGKDDRAADDLVQDIRQSLLSGFIKSFGNLEENERRLYGHKSYFYMKEKGTSQVPEDRDSDGASITSSISEMSLTEFRSVGGVN